MLTSNQQINFVAPCKIVDRFRYEDRKCPLKNNDVEQRVGGWMEQKISAERAGITIF